jgi:putative FmdB family regulatory protein
MPIHEYRCEKCGHTFEKLTFKGDSEKIPCPECDAPNTQKLISAGSFFKGSVTGACVDGSKGFS